MMVLLAVLLMSALLTGCVGQGEQQGQAPPLLPRITVSIDEQGVPSVLGISLDLVGSLIGQGVADIRLSPELVAQMTAANIQHVELVLLNDGIYFFVNGQPIPYLTLDEASWQSLDQLATLLAIPAWDTIQGLRTNVLSRFGVPVAVKFPLQPGVDEVPLRDSAVLPQVDVAAARAAAGEPELVIHTAMEVDSSGRVTIGGLPLENLMTASLGPGTAMVINPDLVATLTAANVQHFQLETEVEGLYTYLNGQALPRLTWDEARLKNAVDLFAALSPQSPVMTWLPLLPSVLPTSNIEVTVYLPVPEGVQAMPVSPFVGSE
jgi:hypothetical protein